MCCAEVKCSLKTACLFRFLTSSSTTMLYRGRVPRLRSDNFMCCYTLDRAGRPWLQSQPSHYTDTDPTSGERGSNQGSPNQEWRVLLTELPGPLQRPQIDASEKSFDVMDIHYFLDMNRYKEWYFWKYIYIRDIGYIWDINGCREREIFFKNALLSQIFA